MRGDFLKGASSFRERGRGEINTGFFFFLEFSKEDPQQRGYIILLKQKREGEIFLD